MLFNYFYTKNHQEFKKSLGYNFSSDDFSIGAYKHNLFLGNKLLINSIRIALPSISLEKDFSLYKQNTIENIAKKNKAFYISGFSFNYQDDNVNCKKQYTFLLDLDKNIDEIYQAIDRSVKKNLKHAKELGISCSRVLQKEGFLAYCDVLKEFRSGNNFRIDKQETLLKQWELMHREKPTKSNYEVFLSKDKNGNILSGMGIIINWEEKQFIEVSIARAKKSIEDKLPDGELLKWSIICWAQENGLKSYNLAGADPDALPGTKEYNIFKYKTKWGATLTPYYFFEQYFVQNRWYYNIFLKMIHLLKK
ncbi:MAG TPA: hypothetical protein PKL98_01010 [Candidatus Pacearchaeota archaeon]|nr:hypothetical protein [Candidatus Parcubacteria bacterium]HNZ83836.1 hypothetical protein [Candidatus Pacearchaeota archaeon]